MVWCRQLHRIWNYLRLSCTFSDYLLITGPFKHIMHISAALPVDCQTQHIPLETSSLPSIFQDYRAYPWSTRLILQFLINFNFNLCALNQSQCLIDRPTDRPTNSIISNLVNSHILIFCQISRFREKARPGKLCWHFQSNHGSDIITPNCMLWWLV